MMNRSHTRCTSVAILYEKERLTLAQDMIYACRLTFVVIFHKRWSHHSLRGQKWDVGEDMAIHDVGDDGDGHM